MATHDYIIANASGAAVRADLNNALAAIVSNNSNATAPATTYAYQWWADTTANQLKLRNSANTDWIVIQELDGTMLMEDGTAAAPGLAFADDVDTGLFRPAANQLGVATNGVERVEFGTTEVVFNDSGANVDFRVEGDAEANLLFVDAGNDHVGIAEAAPGTVLEVGSTEPYVTLKNSTEEDTDGGRESRLIFEGEQSGGEISTLAQIEVSHDGTADDEKGKLVISTNDGDDGASPTARLTVESTGNVTIEDGDLVVASGHGIDFSGTADGSGTTSSELLDDYEEGTWTPTVKGATTAGTYTYGGQTGIYTKIGDTVHASCYVHTITTGSAGSGALRVAGLPFNSQSTTSVFPQGPVRLSYWDVHISTRNVSCSVITNDNEITFVETRDADSASSIQVTDKSNNSAYIMVSLTYQAA
jgi:hypothetical protein